MQNKNIQSRAEFARTCKVSRAAITKAIEKGLIQTVQGGFDIDINNEVNILYRMKNINRSPLKEARKRSRVKVKEYDADETFTSMMEKLNEAKPKSLVEKIKNEVSFELVGLFSAFNGWTGRQLDQSFLVEKCEVWVKSISKGIDKINED
jgi:NADH:ubiquinone oxidoreductase subunit F (NADH-binding)